jgi:hypothetical protein
MWVLISEEACPLKVAAGSTQVLNLNVSKILWGEETYLTPPLNNNLKFKLWYWDSKLTQFCGSEHPALPLSFQISTTFIQVITIQWKQKTVNWNSVQNNKIETIWYTDLKLLHFIYIFFLYKFPNLFAICIHTLNTIIKLCVEKWGRVEECSVAPLRDKRVKTLCGCLSGKESTN